MFAHVHLFSIFLCVHECLQNIQKPACMCSLCCMALNMCVQVHVRVQEHEGRIWTHSCSVSSTLSRPSSASFSRKFPSFFPSPYCRAPLFSYYCCWNCTYCPGVGPQAFSGDLRLTTSALEEVGTPPGFYRAHEGRGPKVPRLKRGGCLYSGTSAHTGLGLLRELCALATPSWTLGILDRVWLQPPYPLAEL